ncbi:hypothetical protein BURPS406E_B0870 [Burkholderia pseudomallei 406e]|uniref:Uncharacterized protein n=4 Tax=pseudomallei group TaxID=111527 RepID=Q3JW94_BURP1|nr:hypothetical protein BURPS1710b_0745 [Burkholderia pseudomallei 1710b]ABM51127.1 conserved hypothetical protein [Burkholderia mallei SAVP1]ABN02462.1 hypothetical protein BMA10229_A1494 [Burkholderia mallei NCTC 10229]ABN85128.1 hypothetical protein BURPS668_0562 [Burkholderia pseudomallei 668]ABN91181.1 hypothetical protein BURPS1106A_0577 [Burkholderia pseudomallei 1106a]ABO04087.1 conserved hypothetical protein [Burkholderia mallei NCTC 10247]ACQ98165.1 conserved hypothetical protein [B
MPNRAARRRTSNPARGVRLAQGARFAAGRLRPAKRIGRAA